MALEAVREYWKLDKIWSQMKEAGDVPEKVEEAHLCEMDAVWYRLSEEEMKDFNEGKYE